MIYFWGQLWGQLKTGHFHGTASNLLWLTFDAQDNQHKEEFLVKCFRPVNFLSQIADWVYTYFLF